MTHRPSPIPPPIRPRGELTGNSTQRIGRYNPPTPINQAAADIIFQRDNAEEWTSANVGNFHHSCHGPLPTLPVHFVTRSINLIGVKFGRMVVVGQINAPASKAGGLLWSCRCACGCYEARRSKAIRNHRNRDDRCFECRRMDRVRAQQLHATTGQHTCANCGEIARAFPCQKCDPRAKEAK